MPRLNFLIKQYTWAIILTAVVFSFIVPSIGFFLKPCLNFLLMTLMFLSCLDLKIGQIVQSFTDYKPMSIALAIVHLVSPLLVVFLQGYFPPAIFLGLIIVTVMPAGRSAVFLSNIYNGQPVKALVVSSISNALSPIVVPLLVWVFAHTTIHINTLEMSSTIIYLVIIPLIFAFIFGRTRSGKILNEYSTSISIFILFLIIMGIISPIRSIITSNLLLTLGLGVLATILILIDFFLGHFLGANDSDHITYAITSSYKNTTLATLLSLSMYQPLVALPAVVYTVVSNILLVPLQFFLSPPPKKHHRQKHQNLLFIVLGFIVTIAISQTIFFKQFIQFIEPYSFLSSFIAGMMFASTFTLAGGGLILVHLAATTNLFILIIFGGLGAVFCDVLIFTLFKDKIAKDISPIYDEFITKSHLQKILHTRYFAWTLPVLGAFIIASPLPDELGVSLMGITQMKTAQFLFITFASHLLGISTLIASSKLF